MFVELAWDSINVDWSAKVVTGCGIWKFVLEDVWFGECCCCGCWWWAVLVAALITDFKLKMLLKPPPLLVVGVELEALGVLDLRELSWFWLRLLALIKLSMPANPVAAIAVNELPIKPAAAEVVCLSDIDASIHIWRFKIQQFFIDINWYN